MVILLAQIQILRHRSFTFQEVSQRYEERNELMPFELRKQADKNRQSSTDHMGSILLGENESKVEFQDNYAGGDFQDILTEIVNILGT